MNIFAIGVTLLIGLLLFVIITNLLSKSRGASGHPPVQDDSLYHTLHYGAPGEHGGQSQIGGDWGGRDMSHDHHDHGSYADSGGGDAGGGGGSGGGGE